MATRSTKSKVQQVATSGRMIMPELITRDLDVKYMGGEPIFPVQPDSDRRNIALITSFNWYNRFFDKKVAKEQLITYADYIGQKTVAKNLRRVEDKQVNSTLAWLARLYLRGLDLTQLEVERLDAELSRLINTLHTPEVIEPIVDKKPKVNVQEIMKEKAREAAGNLEGLLDEFISAGAKTNSVNVNPVSTLTEKNVLPQHISILVEVWKKKLNEFTEVYEGKDKQLAEAYAHYGKNQIKAVIKFIEAVLAGLNSYVSVKKAARAPRKRKTVSPEKQVSKFKFMKAYEDATHKLNLVSVHPAKIIGATEVWAYDTAKRKLWYLVADSHVGTLGVKGATIMGFDTSKSGVKTVRKPGDVLKKLMTAGKPAARKLYSEINSVSTQPNGRSNENLIILKVY